ncbi:UDP-N-acetylglucosamine 1-carboxyvinyltransferase [candidate division WOR-1 bacterium RIFCSPLOWO2_02_FULL_46_20]|uniref:UDP-N-acetylglucosamine 1-carboxyvinyltransferase n=1 Tax=candidate division WOR-1 bacterium RIFCSPLOWO2_02_FULL_46_20 TaxID=1802567 RepID=A0A1F4R4A0_UNCSA|nr:MAG: UDP-N-acetylglucosamine 1-carboxyvinyltransferase [candidate division WOR-1 bacterium RIFCSPHIGHO2_02_FULL_45_12]OGC03061.1 MAG: UDP-N-acetylglucosamine 1-carboxyvinyltransferase [candidate division WOR-1 bacterium RIFCSPLOWO2_02_FULL_46_20]
MRKILINGNKRLEGEVQISGAKNAALAILAATILVPGKITIRNVPNLLDVITFIRVLRALGIRAEYSGSQPNTVEVWNDNVKHVAPYELVTKMRASFFVIGPILARKGLAKIPLPGGCAIGSRPVNLHIKGLEVLGATVKMEHGFVIVSASKLKGGKVYLDFPSVGATESIMMAATLAEGETIIENAAQEPEIVDLANFLNKAGGRVSGAGTEEIRIRGVTQLSPLEYKIIADRIEAGTYMTAAAITKGDVLVKGIQPEFIEATTRKLQEAGVKIQIKNDEVRVSAINGLRATDIKTMPYPGFPTDMQSQFTSLLCLARGTSVVTETVFENRFMHVPELNRMGAEIKLEGQSAIVNGVGVLSSAPVKVSDLRAGAALIVAGLAARGETTIEDRDHHIERGYENLKGKLSGLGADIKLL